MCVYVSFSTPRASNPDAISGTSAGRRSFPFSHVATAALHPTPRRFERCLRRTVGNAAAVTLTSFWLCLLTFCFAELHLICVFRRFRYTTTLCHAPELRLRKLICFAYEKDFVRLLATGTGSTPAGSYLADRCDLFLGLVNCVARLQRQQVRITAALHCTGLHGVHGLIMHFNGVHQSAYQGHNMLQGASWAHNACQQSSLQCTGLHGLHGLLIGLQSHTKDWT